METHTSQISNILGLCSTFISLIVSVYLLYTMRQNTLKRLQRDGHFRLRFALVSLLLVNRIMQSWQLIMRLIIAWKFDGIMDVKPHDYNRLIGQYYRTTLNITWEEYYSLYDHYYLIYGIAGYLTRITLFPMLSLILFLTLDRYHRIMMIIKGTFVHYFFILTQCVMILEWIVAAIDFIFRTFDSYLLDYGGREYFWSDACSKRIVTAHGIVLFFGMTLHYLFTIRLLIKCVTLRDENEQSTVILYQTVKHLVFIRHRTKHSKTANVDRKAQKRVLLGIKMIAVFLLLVMADIAVLLVTVSFATFSSNFDGIFAFGTSWITVHILCLFKLLDMFLEGLKDANHTTILHSKRGWVQRLFPMRESALDSHNTDIVDMSLRSIGPLTQTIPGSTISK